MGSENRKRQQQIKIRLSQKEKNSIKIAAEQFGMTVPGYIRNLGLNYRPDSKVDPAMLDQLSQLHANFNHVGSQIKAWLQPDMHKPQDIPSNIPMLIDELRDLHNETKTLIKEISDSIR